MAIFPLFFLAMCAFDFFHEPHAQIGRGLIIGGGFYFVLGLLDDLLAVSAPLKLAAQILASVASLYALGTIQGLGPEVPFGLGLTFVYPLWILWCVGFINMYNFMDGMNGKAGLFAILVALSFYVGIRIHSIDELAALSPVMPFLVMAIALAASTAGFMLFNCRPKAAIFLGDCGSHFIGFLLAAILFFPSKTLAGPGNSLLASCVLIMPFLFDVTLTMLRRFREGKRIWEAHKEHLYQRLMHSGWGHMRTLALCAVTYIACAALYLWCVSGSSLRQWIALALSIVVMSAYRQVVLYVEQHTISDGDAA